MSLLTRQFTRLEAETLPLSRKSPNERMGQEEAQVSIESQNSSCRSEILPYLVEVPPQEHLAEFAVRDSKQKLRVHHAQNGATEPAHLATLTTDADRVR